MHKYVRIILDQKVIARIGYTEKDGYAVPEAAFYRMKVDEEESATGFKPHRLLYAIQASSTSLCLLQHAPK